MSLKVHKPYVIAEKENHKFIWLGLDEAEAEKGILTNQYMIIDNDEAILLDPGGYFVLERIYDNISSFIDPGKVVGIFYSHQDPDVIGSLSMLLDMFPNVTVYISQLWVRFLPHLGVLTTQQIKPLPDEGAEIPLGKTTLKAVPAHFLHSPGNFNLYDPVVKVLFSGDIGAAIYPKGVWYLFVENFEKHIPLIQPFHKRYLPCSKAVQKWLKHIESLDIEVIAPQHGAIFEGENVAKFLEWLRNLGETGLETMQ